MHDRNRQLSSCRTLSHAFCKWTLGLELIARISLDTIHVRLDKCVGDSCGELTNAMRFWGCPASQVALFSYRYTASADPLMTYCPLWPAAQIWPALLLLVPFMWLTHHPLVNGHCFALNGDHSQYGTSQYNILFSDIKCKRKECYQRKCVALWCGSYWIVIASRLWLCQCSSNYKWHIIFHRFDYFLHPRCHYINVPLYPRHVIHPFGAINA